MALALAILAWVLAAVLAIVLAALILPLRLELRVAAEETVRWSAAVRPFGRLGPRIPLNRAPRRKKRPKTPKTEKPARRSRLRSEPMRVARSAMGFVASVLRAIRIDTLRLDLKFGTGDPGDTGQIYGMLTPLIYGAGAGRHVQIDVEPVFDRAVVLGHAALDASVRPIRILWAALRFGWLAFGPAR